MSSESAYQVANSWVDVGSFLTRLVVSVSPEYFGLSYIRTYEIPMEDF
jgi:hypothetical protein